MDDLLVQFKTKYAITNENLKEIQAAWFREFNDDFVFREIDEEALK